MLVYCISPIETKVLKLNIEVNKLGWAEPHSRFPLNFPYEIWVVVFILIWRFVLIWSPKLKFKFEEDLISSCWDIQPFIFWSSRMSSSFQEFFILVWSPKLKFKIEGRTDQWLLRYSTVYILRLSSIGCRLHFNIFILVWSPKFKFKIWGRSDQWLQRYLIFWGRLPM